MTVSVPVKFDPRSVREWTDLQMDRPNLASNQHAAAMALQYVHTSVIEWHDRLRPLHRRWRGTNYMLSGNTLDRGGPEDVHVPEIYKALETIVPRIEEAILEEDPWFRVIPNRPIDRSRAEVYAALHDWHFQQARVRDLIQPAVRNMLVTQVAAFHVGWEDRKERRLVREWDTKVDPETGMKRLLKAEWKEVVTYSGPTARLIDPFDFIIETKATDPQNAIYVGHRCYMTYDEIERMAEEEGWVNVKELQYANPGQRFGVDQDFYKWTRDPTSRYGDQFSYGTAAANDLRPTKIEVVVLYGKMDPDLAGNYREFRMVAAGGQTVLELRENPYDGQFRPYATARVTKSGHEFYGTGPFDNAIRLNQHLDRYHKIFLRAAHLSACPMVFAEEDAEIPDSLYDVKPFTVWKGTGPVRFSQVPDGTLRAAPLVIGLLQRDIEECIGAFRIQMGQQDVAGGTATEASLSLQEGNRRMRGLIRAFGDGMEQLLQLFHRMTLQFSTSTIEFPVLGKRAAQIRKQHANLDPADLLQNVHFDLVGLHSLRTSGLKATGLQAFVNSMMPMIVAHPEAVDQVALMHTFAKELIGPDEADQLVRVPTPLDRLLAQEEENEMLILGNEVDVDKDDDDEDHMRKMLLLFKAAANPDTSLNKQQRIAIIKHYVEHGHQKQRKEAQARVREQRMQQQMPMPQAGGTPSEAGGHSPQRGGMSDALSQMSGRPGGQTGGETPGMMRQDQYPRAGGASRPLPQSNNSVE